jgi:hypothetical protein
MATYVNNLRLKEITTGDEDGTWGTSTNTNLELIGESLGYATQAAFASDADATTTVADGATDPARALYLKVTSGASLTATRTLTIGPNTVSRVMWIENATSGSQSINISQGSGANVTIATGATKIVYLDGAGSGAAVVDANANVPGGNITLSQVTDVTSTAAEVNLLDGSVAGTIVNSKGVIYGASGEVNATTLQISGTAITSTAAELNILDGVTATATELNYLDITTLGTTAASKAVTADANGVVTFDNGKIEESTAITSSSNAATINLRDGDNFTHTLSENVTYTFSNPAASGKVSAFSLKVIQDSSARTITWPGSVDWAAATAPTLTATSGGVDVFVFVTYDGGTNYYGFTAGQAMG